MPTFCAVKSRSRSRSPRRHSSRTMSSNMSKRVVISNIAYDVKWQDIKDLFRKEVGDTLTYVELFNNPDGKPKGTGVVEFKDGKSAAEAIDKMHRYELRERKLVVREEKEREKHQNDMLSTRYGGSGGVQGSGMIGEGPMGGDMRGMGGGGMMGGGLGGGRMMGGGGGGLMGGMGGGAGLLGSGAGAGLLGSGGAGLMGNGVGGGMAAQNMGNAGTAGISPQLLQQIGIDRPVTNTVFINNLDYRVTWQKLKDVFKLAGKILRVEVREDGGGKSRGIATIQFETAMQAVQAISMFNNQELYDRTMRVKMANTPERPGGMGMDMGPALPGGLKGIGPSLQDYGLEAGTGGGMDMGMGSGNMGMGSGAMGMGSGGMGLGASSNMGMGNMDSMGHSMGGGLGTGMGMSGMGNMGSGGMGMSGMGGMSSNLGMGDSYGMSSGGSRLNDGMGLASLGNMGNSFGGMRSSGMGNMGVSGMDYGRGGAGSGMAANAGSRLDGMNIRPDRSTVVVKNLPYTMDWQTLKQKFQAVGDIRFAEIKMENGRSCGWGLVSFRKEEDAVTAVDRMHRANFDGRDIVVKLLQ